MVGRSASWRRGTCSATSCRSSAREAVTTARVLVLADDLIWATRLAGLVRSARAEVRVVRSIHSLLEALPEADRVIVDLTARGYDGIDGVAAARASGVPILCVAQHDDVELRQRALAAGAGRVEPYRRLADDGSRILAAWLGTPREALSDRTTAP